MKKIFTRILGATLGLAMVVGAGFGISNNKYFTKLVADSDVSWVAADFADQGTSGSGSEMTLSESGITVTISKGYKGGGNAYAQSYANSSFTFSGGSTYIITGFTITANGTNYNGSQSSGTMSVSPNDGTLTRSAESTAISYSGGTHTSVTLSHEKQIRFNSISVTYAASGGPSVSSVSVSGDMTKTSYTTVEKWSNTGLTATVTMSDSSEYTGQTNWSYSPTTPAAAVIANSKSEVADLSVTATATASGESGSKATEGISVSYATVANGLAAIPNLNDQIEGVIVRGTVSYIDSIDPTTYHNATYFISDDGTRTNELEVFRGRGVDNVDITNVNDIKVGDVVLVYGNLEYHDGNPDVQEFLANNYLLSLDRPASLEPSITITEAGFTMRVGDADITLHNTPENIPDGGSIKWVSGTPAVATIGEASGLVHAVAPGTTEITAKIVDSGDNMVASNSITVTVIDNSLSDGDTFIIKATYSETAYYLSGVDNNLGTTSTTRTDAWVFTAIEGTTPGQFRFKYGNYYLNYTSGNNLYKTTDGSLDSTLFTATNYGSNDVIENVSVAGRKLQYNYSSGNPRFACYTSNQTVVVIEKVTAPVVSSVSVDGDEFVNGNNALSVVGNYTYSVTYADLGNIGPGSVTVEVLDCTGNTTNDAVASAPSAGAFTVTFKANGEYTIVAYSLEDPAKTNYLTVYVDGVFTPSIRFSKLYGGTDVSGNMKLMEGDYVLYYNGNFLRAAITSNRAEREEVAPSLDPITAYPNVVWHIAPVGEYYTIYNASVEKYLSATGTASQAQLVDDTSDNKAKWIITIRPDGRFEFENYGRSLLENSGRNSRWLRNNGSSGWAAYTNATGGAITLFRNYVSSMSSVATVIGTEENPGVVTSGSVSLVFGAKILAEDWAALKTTGTITDYGVALVKKTTMDTNSYTYVYSAYMASVTHNIAKGSGDDPYLQDGYYYFSVNVNITEGASDYGTVYCACPYIVVGGSTVHFLPDLSYSVNTLAAYCLANGGCQSNLSNEALGTLVA